MFNVVTALNYQRLGSLEKEPPSRTGGHRKKNAFNEGIRWRMGDNKKFVKILKEDPEKAEKIIRHL